MTNEGPVAPRERVLFEYRAVNASLEAFRELPLKILVLGDFSRRGDARRIAERRPFPVDQDTFAQRLQECAPAIDLTVPDRTSEAGGAELSLSLRFGALEDFTPDGVARQVPATREMLEMRSALCALKVPRGYCPSCSRSKLATLLTSDAGPGVPLGPCPSHRSKLAALLADEGGRDRLRRDLERSRRPGADGAAEGSALVEVLADARITPQHEAFDFARRGLIAYLETEMAQRREGGFVLKSVVDALLGDLDAKVAEQVNAVLHHPAFQRLESAWRSLKYLVDAVEFRERITIDVLDCSKGDVAVDFEGAPDASRSGLYEVLHAPARHGAENEPYGLILADYEFGPSSRDVWLLSRFAAIAEASQAPFLAAAAPSMAGASKWSAAPHGEALAAALDGADRDAWRSFRARGESRYAGLCAPRVVLRLPFGSTTVPVKPFNFEEDVVGRDERYLWGNAAFAFAACVARAFAKYRICANIVGPDDGALLDLPLHLYQSGDEIVARRPVEATFSDPDLSALSAAGFIVITDRDNGDVARWLAAPSCALRGLHFADAPSCHLPEGTSETSPEALGRRLLSQLPYVFMVARIAHHVVAVHGPPHAPRLDEGGARARLDEWLRTCVTEVDEPPPSVRVRRPLREASIRLEAARPPMSGYRYELRVRPHFTFGGAPFVLSVAGRLAP